MVDAWVVVIIIAATLIRFAFGFGEALIAVPLLSLLNFSRSRHPLSITVAAVVTGQGSAFPGAKGHVDKLATMRHKRFRFNPSSWRTEP